jgi:phosphopantetheinyl transferase
MRRAWARPGGEAWLSEPEREAYAVLRDARRREAWLFGRLLCKELILAMRIAAGSPGGGVEPGQIEVLSRDGLGRPARPRVLLHGRLQPWSLSLAHSDQSVLVGLSRDGRLATGVDVTPIQSPDAGFLDLWFTPRERAWIRAKFDQAARWAATLWAIKEAFYKAVNVGESFAPRQIEVRVDPLGGYVVRWLGSRPTGPCRVRVAAGRSEVVAVVTVALQAGRAR